MRNPTFIIIITYNGIPWIDKCLASCKDYAVIVVDNASSDGTVKYIKTNFTNVTVLDQSCNLGFGQANNIGIRYALDQGAEHVFLLNQDAYLVDDVLDKLVVFQTENPNYGILSPIHITGDKRKLDKSFSNFMLKEVSGQFYSDFVLSNTLAAVYEVPFVNAAAWLISKKCLETIGGFDPLFFHYGEDDNYCQRVLFHGLKIGVLPKCYLIHDRADRQKIDIGLFSEDYYKSRETKYKVICANILVANIIDEKINKLKRSILKLLLQMRFLRADGIKKELVVLKNLVPQIKESRARNKLNGNHYL